MTTATETFARRLREERELAGLSQAALAEQLSQEIGRTVDPSALARSEKHQRPVRLDEAVALAEILGVPLTALISDEDARALQLAGLRHEVEEQRDREKAAWQEVQQAQSALMDLEQQIEQMETAVSD